MLQLLKNIWVMQLIVAVVTYGLLFILNAIINRYNKSLAKFWVMFFFVFGAIFFGSMEIINLVAGDKSSVFFALVRTFIFLSPIIFLSIRKRKMPIVIVCVVALVICGTVYTSSYESNIRDVVENGTLNVVEFNRL